MCIGDGVSESWGSSSLRRYGVRTPLGIQPGRQAVQRLPGMAVVFSFIFQISDFIFVISAFRFQVSDFRFRICDFSFSADLARAARENFFGVFVISALAQI